MFQKIIYIIFFSLISFFIHGQGDDFFKDLRLESEVDVSLLPDKMVFTQKLFWGKNGLFRKTGVSKLSLENREKELVLREKMLIAHQILGYVTFAGMIAQGILGGK